MPHLQLGLVLSFGLPQLCWLKVGTQLFLFKVYIGLKCSGNYGLNCGTLQGGNEHSQCASF